MLQIGCPKAKILKKKIDGLDYEGIRFKVESVVGLTLMVSHNSNSDVNAKSVIKKYITQLSEFKNVYTNIQMVDKNGRII